jgi:hypothetical protein
MRTPLGTWRRSLIAFCAAALLTMTPAISTTTVLALDPDCGSACPEKK